MVKDGVEKIDRSREEILAIVNDLLTLSEIGFSYKKTNTKMVDFKALISDAVRNLQNAVTGKSLTIEFVNHTQNTKAEVNEFAISKAIENLIDNAITYSNDGGRIAIELSGNLKEITFSVTDHGVGVPKEDQEKIFQQFFRAKNAVVKKNVGTGLGLFIVKIIVEGHSGTVAAESEENQGATFHFTIPRQ